MLSIGWSKASKQRLIHMSSFEVMNEIQGKIILGAYIAPALWTAEQSGMQMPLRIHINGKYENVKVVEYITAAMMHCNMQMTSEVIKHMCLIPRFDC